MRHKLFKNNIFNERNNTQTHTRLTFKNKYTGEYRNKENIQTESCGKNIHCIHYERDIFEKQTAKKKIKKMVCIENAPSSLC